MNMPAGGPPGVNSAIASGAAFGNQGQTKSIQGLFQSVIGHDSSEGNPFFKEQDYLNQMAGSITFLNLGKGGIDGGFLDTLLSGLEYDKETAFTWASYGAGQAADEALGDDMDMGTPGLGDENKMDEGLGEDMPMASPDHDANNQMDEGVGDNMQPAAPDQDDNNQMATGNNMDEGYDDTEEPPDFDNSQMSLDDDNNYYDDGDSGAGYDGAYDQPDEGFYEEDDGGGSNAFPTTMGAAQGAVDEGIEYGGSFPPELTGGLHSPNTPSVSEDRGAGVSV